MLIHLPYKLRPKMIVKRIFMIDQTGTYTGWNSQSPCKTNKQNSISLQSATQVFQSLLCCSETDFIVLIPIFSLTHLQTLTAAFHEFSHYQQSLELLIISDRQTERRCLAKHKAKICACYGLLVALSDLHHKL